MKKLLIIAMLVTSLSSIAQDMFLFGQKDYVSYGEKFYNDLEYTVPIGFLIAGFATNEYYIHTTEFANLSQVKRNQNTFKVYATSAILTVGSHYLINWLEKKPFKKRKHNYKHKF